MSRDHQKTVAVRMAAATRVYRARVGALLSPIGIHAGQESVLKALSAKDGQAMTELAAELGVQPPTVTKMVGRLAAHGYVERRASASDGRQAHVFLTALGQEALAEIDDVLERVERRALTGIDEKDQKRLLRMLRRIARNLGDHDTSSPEAG
jgi:MarR family transcriptional regulator, organic hydroperoxide resistance regulator